MEFTVQDQKTSIANRGLITSDMQEIRTAIVKFENGDWMGVSQWHDEDYWAVDCAFRANGYPLWSNGTGSRCVAFRALPQDAAEVVTASF